MIFCSIAKEKKTGFNSQRTTPRHQDSNQGRQIANIIELAKYFGF